MVNVRLVSVNVISIVSLRVSANVSYDGVLDFLSDPCLSANRVFTLGSLVSVGEHVADI